MPERALNNRTSNYQNVSAHDQSRQHNGDNFYHNGGNFYGNVTFQHTLAAPATPSIAPGHGYIDFLETLKFEQMDSRYVTVQSQLLGTCKWILDTPEYKTWLDPEMVSKHHGFLWIKGKAGAGKSTIMKFASESTQARCVNRQHVLSFFFSARAGSMETSVNGLFRSLLHQLLNKVPGLYGLLDKRRLDLVKRQGWTSMLLKATFEDAVLKLTEDSVTCFIDAMDECRADDVQEVISYFDNLGDSLTVHPGLLRVCLSSRIYPNLKSIRSVELVLEKQLGHEKDIRTYIDRRLIVDSKHLKRNLGNIIERKARGVFMWVVLVISLLNKEDRSGNAHMMHKRLEQMPAGLSDLIDDLLERGPRNPYFRPLLQLMAFAPRKLDESPQSIYSALKLGMSVTGNDEMDINPSSSESRTHEKFILDAFKGLLEIVGVGDSARAQYIHESVRTYFMNEGLKYLTSKDGTEVNRVIEGETSNSQIDTFETMSTRCHHDLMRFCIRYVEAAVEIEMATPQVIFDKRLRRFVYRNKEDEPFPFLLYVRLHFWKHVEKAWKGRSPQKVCLESIPTKVLDVLQPSLLSWDVGDAHLSKEPLFKVACVLTYKDISTILSVVLEAMSASGLAQRGLHYLLSISVRENSQGCTSVLLQAGADPNAETERGVPLLNLALRERHFEVVKQLLDAGARPYGISDEQVDSLYDECARRESRELLMMEHLVAETDDQFMTYLSACALGQAIFRGEKEWSMTLAEDGMKFGLWSYTVVDDEASDIVTMELEAKDEAIAARIQGQAPAVRRSLHNKTKLLMRLEKRAQELEAQTIGGLIEATIS